MLVPSLRREVEAGIHERTAFDELGIVVHRGVDDPVTWVALTSEAQSLELSLESAQVLLQRLTEVLARVTLEERGEAP